MFLTRWNKSETPARTTFGHLFDLRDELDRLIESPLAELARTSRLLTGLTPAVDLYEDNDHFVVKAELPGLKREDIQVSLHDGALSISGERKTETKSDAAHTRREERHYGHFHRAIALPRAVQAEKVTARYQDGILTVTLPKSEEAKPKQIAVNVK